jgi:small GTP-binding protein
MDILRFATAGSVDDGKSTLIGRLLFDSKAIFEDQLEAVERTSRDRGTEYTDLSLLTDGLRAEREQGITIDVAYRYFATPRRKFIIADTPGHIQYTRNMVTGASTADLAIILIDARKGVLEQSRRHAFLTTLLRVPHLVLAVNKMDLVDYSEERFEEIREEFTAFASKLNVADLTFIPISALNGDNVVSRSENMPWYHGSSLLHHLENVHIASDRNLVDVRFPVQYVIRPQRATDHAFHDYRGYAGQVRRAQARRRGRPPPLGPGHPDRLDRHLRRAGGGGVPAHVGDAPLRGRHRHLARRHDRPAQQPAAGGAGDRRHDLLDGRQRQAGAALQAHDQAHDADGSGARPRPALPARRQHAAPRRDGHLAVAQRDRTGVVADHPAVVRGRLLA